MKPEEKVIMYDSPEAARKVNLVLEDGTHYGSGWVSSERRFYVTEDEARRYGSTHKKCECGDIVSTRSYCRKCSDRKARERYFKMEEKEWNGKDMLTLHDDDRWFSDMDEVAEYAADNDIEPTDLMLVICTPNYMHTVDGSQWEDIMPEDSDGDLPKEVEAKLKELNEAIENAPPISWSAGKYRTKYIDSSIQPATK